MTLGTPSTVMRDHRVDIAGEPADFVTAIWTSSVFASAVALGARTPPEARAAGVWVTTARAATEATARRRTAKRKPCPDASVVPHENTAFSQGSRRLREA
jgi:hypothetical protein